MLANKESPRQRAKNACGHCKRKKVKCDGKLPCSTCRIHKSVCDYSSIKPNLAESFQLRKPKNDDYVRYLENKVLELQKTSSKAYGEPNLDDAFVKNHYLGNLSKYDVLTKYHSIFPHELAKNLAMGISSNEQKEVSIPRIQFYGWNMSCEPYLKPRSLPPAVLLIDLVAENEFTQWILQFYFREINPLFSIILEKVFWDQYNQYILNLSESVEETRLFNAMLYLMIAISMRFSREHPLTPNTIKPKLRFDLECSLFEHSYEVICKLSFEWNSLELIQCWILITFYLRVTHRQNSSYASLGMAIRMCKGMCLNLNVVNESLSTSKSELSNANRVFWIVYTWDKLYSFQCGKQFDIRDDTISVNFPPLGNTQKDKDAQLGLGDPALAMIHLAQITGKIMHHNMLTADLNKEFLATVKEKLDNWKVWWDDRTQDVSSLVVQQVYLTFHDVYLSMYNKVLFKFLDRECVFDDTNSHISDLVYHSTCVLAIFASMKETGHHAVPWWLTLSLLFNVSVISITLMNVGIRQTDCRHNLKISLDLLSVINPKATMAKECIWAIKMLNHISVLRFMNCIKSFSEVGIDHGSNHVNAKNFHQFGKVRNPSIEEGGVEDIENGYMRESELEDLIGLDSDLFANLRWFDQWSNDIYLP